MNAAMFVRTLGGEVADDDQVDVALLVEVPPAGERPVEDDSADTPARPDLASESPDLLHHPASARLAALQIESACSHPWYRPDGQQTPVAPGI